MKKLLVVIGIIIMALPAAAKEGFYAGAAFVHDKMLNSDFDSLNSATGLDLKFGYSFGSFSLEGNLMGSKHDSRKAGYGDANFGGISLDFRIPFTGPEQQNQVYVLAGLGGYSVRGYDPTLAGDVKYSGGGYNLGLGVEHYFNQHAAFDLTAIYRAIKYNKKEAPGGETTISPKLNGDTLSIAAGMNYHF